MSFCGVFYFFYVDSISDENYLKQFSKEGVFQKILHKKTAARICVDRAAVKGFDRFISMKPEHGRSCTEDARNRCFWHRICSRDIRLFRE